MTSVREIKGIGEKTEKLLKRMNIETVDQLLHHYPRCYITYPEPVSVDQAAGGQRCSIRAKVASPVHLRATRRVKLCTCLVADQSGSLFLRWFNMPYLKKNLVEGQEYIFTGTPIFKEGRLMIEQAEIYTPEKYRKQMQTLQPVYPLTAGLSNRTLQKAQKAAFSLYRAEEYLPETVREYYGLEEEDRSLREIHFPTGTETLGGARKRIIFDEFFRFFSALEMVKEQEEKSLNQYIIPMDERVRAFVEALPFPLTGAQKKTLEDIRQDLSGKAAMNRLVQGDVGSGKTVVAVTAMYAAVLAGYQAVMMAPTEVLASQHYETVRNYLSPYNIEVGLLMGSTKAAEKRRIKADLESGAIQVLIGTHAVIQEGVNYRNLALAITDEQHRFGVRQRDSLMKKGQEPHVLVMSATPIPRTLGIILYRDMDVSVMDELPASRLPIKNSLVGRSYRPAAWRFIEKQVAAGHQAYVICPMIEENEKLDLENVEEYTRSLTQALPPSVRVQSLNGKMSAAEKQDIMGRFSSGEIDILVSTTVVEVGVDVPAATVMLIENAERFGLAQLHQLRGRVGRGEAQSYCIFLAGTDEKEAMDRLSVVAHSNDGFQIASEDLKLRGPGDFFGTSQSGTMNFALGDVYANADILKMASEAVDHLKQEGYLFTSLHRDSLEEHLNFAKNI